MSAETRQKIHELKQAPAESVALCWVHPGQVSGAFMESILKLERADLARPVGQQRIMRTGAGYLNMVSGPRIASARNTLVRIFLEQYKAEWLLMIDTDMVFEPEALDTLFQVADKDTAPIVGGLCFGGGHGALFPTMYRLQDPKENDGKIVDWVREWEPGSVVQVDATGAAFILMHRSLLQAMGEKFPEPAPWYSETVYKGKEFGEDWSFCLRAMQMNVPVYVHTGASIGHMKPVMLDESIWRAGGTHLATQGAASSNDAGPEGEAEQLTVIKKELVVVGAA